MSGWDRFVHARPGRRFQDRYRRMRQAKGGAWKRGAFVCGGIALALVGIFFMAVPGPGIPIFAIGLALVAQESTFDPVIRSSANAVGLMQVLPSTGRQFARKLKIPRYSAARLTDPVSWIATKLRSRRSSISMP